MQLQWEAPPPDDHRTIYYLSDRCLLVLRSLFVDSNNFSWHMSAPSVVIWHYSFKLIKLPNFSTIPWQPSPKSTTSPSVTSNILPLLLWMVVNELIHWRLNCLLCLLVCGIWLVLRICGVISSLRQDLSQPVFAWVAVPSPFTVARHAMQTSYLCVGVTTEIHEEASVQFSDFSFLAGWFLPSQAPVYWTVYTTPFYLHVVILGFELGLFIV